MQDFLHDRSGRLDYRDLPPSEVAVNYPMEVVEGSTVGHSPWNGASSQSMRQTWTTLTHDGLTPPGLWSGVTRQIPGTQNSRQPIPTLEEEPRWMKLSVSKPPTPRPLPH